jgi:uncharacterized Zn-binding protein involved in type VI secretion
MPAPILTLVASVTCPHAAPASIAATGARVLVAGQPAALLSDLTTVAGCPLASQPTPSPCVTVTWIAGSTRMLAGGQPVLLQTSTGLAQNPALAPQGAPLILAAQTRVLGS